MRYVIGAAVALALQACTSLADMKPAERQQFFVLQQDHVRVQILGLMKVMWVQGLKSGKYTATREDKNGIYFQGEGACIIQLSGDDAEEYQKTGTIPEKAEKDTRRYPRALSAGGLWIPKPSSKDAPKLFWEIRLSKSTDQNNLGLTGWAVAAAVEGSLDYIPFGSEKDFVTGLDILGP